jgi:mRNA degradation ribonuclease J1/J2
MYEPLSANFGIQHFIPKLDYIEQMRDRVKGIFLSQGNKLENGAITEIMKIVPKAPIYGSKETLKFLELLYEQSNN